MAICAIVADDEEVIRKMVSGIIRDVAEGISVREVENGRDLTKEVLGGNYDFVFTDNNMEGGNGLEAVREIRKHNPHIPICMASSDSRWTGKPLEQQAREAGVTDFLYKPFTIKELEAVVKKYIEIKSRSK